MRLEGASAAVASAAVHTRQLTNLDLWNEPTKPAAVPLPARAVRLTVHSLPHVAPPRRQLVSELRRLGDGRQASAAAATLAEFVEAQRGLAASAPRRSPRRTAVAGDDRLWLDPQHWLAWTICGELVVVEEIEPGSMRGSPEIRRLSPAEFAAVFAPNRLISNVIALYPGDNLNRGAVWRYLAHFDLRKALHAALARAKSLTPPPTVSSSPPPASPQMRRPRTATPRKTRHHPLGNFIAFRRPRADEGLPDFAAILQLPPVPVAFPDRRSALRYLHGARLLETPADGLVVARVLGSVEVQLRWRDGFRAPTDAADVVATIRREPRVVLPELVAAWLPRYVLSPEGEWHLERTSKRGTVRARVNEVLLQRVREEGRRVAHLIEENSIRRTVGEPETPIEQHLSAAIRVVQRAERRLPKVWRDQIGVAEDSLGPDWSTLAAAPAVAEGGHWLRAPVEHGYPHADGQRRWLVELRIDDLAGLVEVAGLRPQFLLLKDSTLARPRWALPVQPATALPS